MTLTDAVGTRSVLTFRGDAEVVPVGVKRTDGGVQGVAEETGEPGRAGLRSRVAEDAYRLSATASIS